MLISLSGWALMFISGTLWIYAAFIAILFHLRIVFGEEPWLARTHDAAWMNYRAHVPRWLGRVTGFHALRFRAGPVNKY